MQQEQLEQLELEESRQEEPFRPDQRVSELVFEEIRFVDSNWDDVDRDSQGTLAPIAWERAARPHLYVGESEEYVYVEDGWSDAIDEGQIEIGYRVFREPNDGPVSNHVVGQESDYVDERLRDPASDHPIRLLVKFRDFRKVLVPRPLPPEYFSESVREAHEELRQQRLQDAMAAIEVMAEDLRAIIGEQNILELFPNIGWALVEVSGAQVEDLIVSNILSAIEVNHDPESQDLGFLGPWRGPTLVGTWVYWTLGQYGQTANPGQHSHGRMTAGVVESFGLEDHSPCFLQSGSTGGTCGYNPVRHIHSYSCHTGTCNALSAPFPASWRTDTSAGHGTAVSSIILADYQLGQGDGVPLGDPGYPDPNPGGHSTLWMSNATGFAPEAGLRFFGRIDGSTSAYTSAYGFHGLDVMNMSHSWGTFCTPLESGARQDQLAAAWDNGVFLVAAAGNCNATEGPPCDTSCRTRHPASMPRVFAVNSLNGLASSCLSDYSTCVLPADRFARGGADLAYSSGTVSGAVSVVDTAVPMHHRRRTRADFGNHGLVVESAGGGTSLSAPVVSGAALLVKGWMVQNGISWANSPGRLHAVMLTMSDRWNAVTGNRVLSGSNVLSGMGRFKVRSLQVGVSNQLRRTFIRTYTHTPSSPSTRVYMPWSGPNQSNVTLVKCAMAVPEDHRTGSTASDIYLSARLRQPVGGVCDVSNPGSIIATRSDASFDVKHMVAFDTNTVGACVEVTVHKVHVPAGKSIPTSIFCYGATIDDQDLT